MTQIARRELAEFRDLVADDKSTRDGFGRGLLGIAEHYPKVLVLDADLSRSTRTEWWAKDYPERFINCGIAEQNMMGMAAGLASLGFIPFATTYAIFIARAFDQIRQSICYARQNVKIVGCHAGLAASYDGGSHQGLEDIALMRALPGMTIYSPFDYQDAVEVVRAAIETEGPAYIRLQKENVPSILGGEETLSGNRMVQWGTGRDIALVASGSRVAASLRAAARLADHGIAARVVGIGCLKPMDAAALCAIANEVRMIGTVEEHLPTGGLFDATCAALAGTSCPVRALGQLRGFSETGAWANLLDTFALDSDGIEREVRTLLAQGEDQIGYPLVDVGTLR